MGEAGRPAPGRHSGGPCAEGPLRRVAARLAAGPRQLFGDFAVLDIALYLGLVGAPLLLHLLAGGLYTLETSAMMSAANGSAVTLLLLSFRGRRRRLRMRRECTLRCEHLLDRIKHLLDTIPCRTEAKTLATLHEIRNCYMESIELIDRMGEGGSQVAAKMRMARDQIDEMYDIQTGSLRRTEANAADFAAAMRSLGRDVDGAMRRGPRPAG